MAISHHITSNFESKANHVESTRVAITTEGAGDHHLTAMVGADHRIGRLGGGDGDGGAAAAVGHEAAVGDGALVASDGLGPTLPLRRGSEHHLLEMERVGLGFYRARERGRESPVRRRA